MTLLSVYFNDWINKPQPITNQHIVIIIVCKPSLVTFLRRFLLFVCSQCKSLCPYGSSDLHFLFSRLLIRLFLAAVSLFPNSYKPVRAIFFCMRTYPGSVHFLPDHSGGISVSRVLMVFLYFAQFPSLITVVFTLYLLVNLCQFS